MTFAYPLGFLALLAIPVLVLIYIIKNRYTEQTIPSTYIWNLSEKFLKRRVPISKIAGILSLILQILTVIFISFAITQPSVVLANSASSYCFVLDGSGSMNFVQNGQTRFEIAKDRIVGIIDDSANGSDYTLIFAGSSTEVIFEKETDKKVAKQLIAEREIDFVAEESDIALDIVQQYFDDNPSVKTYLVTDKTYAMYDNVTLVNVAKSVQNFALRDVEYAPSGKSFKVTGTAVAYETDSMITVNLYVDDSSQPYTQSVFATQSGMPFEFVCQEEGFKSFRVEIANDDALDLDNQVIIFNLQVANTTVTNADSQQASNILLVSDSPFFIRAALISAGYSMTDVKFVTTDDYDGSTGFGLYIFDSFTPSTLPDDGAVWFINPKATVAGTNFSYQGVAEATERVQYETDTNSVIESILNGVSRNAFEVKQYVKCGISRSSIFRTVMYCEDSPLLFVGANVYGNREVVFAFDLKDSAPFVMSADFSVLVKNLLAYSFPTIISDTYYHCGDILPVNVIAGCKSIKIVSPSGKTAYPDVSSGVCEYRLTEVGVYDIVLVMKDNTERVVNIFSAIGEEERVPITMGMDFTVQGTAANQRFDGYYDLLWIMFVILAVLVAADYGVYCYEQYQLR